MLHRTFGCIARKPYDVSTNGFLHRVANLICYIEIFCCFSKPTGLPVIDVRKPEVHMFESQLIFFVYFNRNESIPDSNRLICGN